MLLLAIAFGNAPLDGQDKEKPAEAAKEETVEAYDSKTNGAIEVKVDNKKPTDSFDVLQDGKRVFKGNPKLLNTTLELPPGAYVVDVNKTQRKVTIVAGKKTILLDRRTFSRGQTFNNGLVRYEGESKTHEYRRRTAPQQGNPSIRGNLHSFR